MAPIFISYSRADTQFIDELVPLLEDAYGRGSAFYDEQIPGGTKWWDMILRKIAACDLFIYLCSNESLRSPYCQSELREAVRLNKQILPVIVRPKTDYPFPGVDYGSEIPDDVAITLRDTNCIDLSRGFRDRDQGAKASFKLLGAINKAFETARATIPQVVTSVPTPQPPVGDKRKRSWLNEPRAIIVAAVITGVFVIAAALISSLINPQNAVSSAITPSSTSAISPTTQEVAAVTSLTTDTPAPTARPSDTSEPTNTLVPSVTPSPTLTLSITPDLAATAQFLERSTQTMYALQREQTATQSANFTLAASSWTPIFTMTRMPTRTSTSTLTSTVDRTATANHELTRQFFEFSSTQTADARWWLEMVTQTAAYIESQTTATLSSLSYMCIIINNRNENVVVRSGPTSQFPSVASVSPSQRAYVLQSQTNIANELWYAIMFSETGTAIEGWVLSTSITPVTRCE